VDAHTTLACSTVEGIGANLVFTLEVGGQQSWTFASTVSYAPPSIEKVSQNILATEGSEEVVISGDNFGPIGTAIDGH